MRTAVLVTFTAGALLAACGGDGPPPPPPIFTPYLPGPETRIVEGHNGWLLGVPASPVKAGQEAEIWLNNSEAERGKRFEVAIDIDAPPGGMDGWINFTAAAAGWAFQPFRATSVAGKYTVRIVDLGSPSQETLVEAEFTVVAP